jgi:hypothetical protein
MEINPFFTTKAQSIKGVRINLVLFVFSVSLWLNFH